MIWTNSKYVGGGDVFLATSKNYKYIDLNLLKKVSEIVFVSDENKFIYDNYYNKIKDLKLIGITGTNGKTTTCYLIYQMLNLIGIKTAYIGTIGFYIDDMVFKLDNTISTIIESVILPIMFIIFIFNISLQVGLTLGIISVLSIIIGLAFKYKSYSVTGYVTLVLTVIIQTFELWGKMPWWVYLLITGIILVVLAALRESKKK